MNNDIHRQNSKTEVAALFHISIYLLCVVREIKMIFILFVSFGIFWDDGGVTERQTYPLTIEPYCVIVWKGLVWWSVKCYVVYLQTVSSNIICERRNEIKPVVSDHQPSRLLTIFSEAARWSLKFVCRLRQPAGRRNEHFHHNSGEWHLVTRGNGGHFIISRVRSAETLSHLVCEMVNRAEITRAGAGIIELLTRIIGDTNDFN